MVLAEMRTGSNFLETNLNAFDGISCLGEAFNPYFIAYPNAEELMGFTQQQRDAAPMDLLNAIRSRDGMNGFRYFHDHDPRVLDAILDDPRIAKVILTRNPLDSYVSWKIAQATGQWKLTNAAKRKAAKIVFDAPEFEAQLGALQAFRHHLRRRLQTTGQTAFELGYDDLQSLEVINGLGRFLGVQSPLEDLNRSLKVQNPGAVDDKVSNAAEMRSALSRMDMGAVLDFEPRRPAVVPHYVAALKAPILYMPIKGGPDAKVKDWLAALDGAGPDALKTGFNQKTLRQWKRQSSGHRSFTVVRHPVVRAHHAFCTYILGTGPSSYTQIRQSLIKRFGVKVPETMPDDTYDLQAHRTAFLAFLDFLSANLTGQTAIRVDGAWCTQAEALRGFGRFALPDRIVREDEMAVELSALAQSMGYARVPKPAPDVPDSPFALADVYNDDIEDKVSDVYQRDYMMFGFDRWDD